MLLSYIDGVTFHCCFSITLIDKHQRINNTTKIERRKSKEYLFYDASSFYDKLYPVSRTTADGGRWRRNDEGVTYYTVTMKHSASTAFFGNNMHFDCQNKRNPFLPTFNAASIQFSLLSQIIYTL